MAFTRGQRTRLAELGVGGRLDLEIGVRPADRFLVVVAGLGPDERLVDSTFLLSTYQPDSFEGSVRLVSPRAGGPYELQCDLERIPRSVTSLRIVLVGVERWSADSLDESWLGLAQRGGAGVRWAFSGADMAGERAVIVADVYRKDDWRIVLLASGYRAGLSDFLARIGGPKRLPGSPLPSASPPASPAPPGTAAAPRARPAPPAAPPPPPPSSPPKPRPAPLRPGHIAEVPAGTRDRPAAPARPGLSWRERLLSPPVARAAASPAALGLGAGGAVGGAVAAGLAFGSGAALAGAVAVGALGWGAKVVGKVPKRVAGERIDPFSLREPWRHFVRDALDAKTRFDQQVDRTRPGPVRDRLLEMAERFQVGVDECWRIARRGGSLVEARLAIDDTAIQAELRAAEGETTRVLEPGSMQVSVINALRSQLDTAARLDRIIDETYDGLRLLDARLDDTVARAIELSVAASDLGAVDGLGDQVDDLVVELELLRSALEETSHGPDRSGLGTS